MKAPFGKTSKQSTSTQLVSLNLTYNGQGQIEPLDKADLPLFMHCAAGMISVTQHYYETSLLPILAAHNILVPRIFKHGE